jgi:hypothetical protein
MPQFPSAALYETARLVTGHRRRSHRRQIVPHSQCERPSRGFLINERLYKTRPSLHEHEYSSDALDAPVIILQASIFQSIEIIKSKFRHYQVFW